MRRRIFDDRSPIDVVILRCRGWPDTRVPNIPLHISLTFCTIFDSEKDLAYATYVLEYSSGRFEKARHHAERAITIITNLLPSEHLLLASSKRVKALILEEIAIDSNNKEIQVRWIG